MEPISDAKMIRWHGAFFLALFLVISGSACTPEIDCRYEDPECSAVSLALLVDSLPTPFQDIVIAVRGTENRVLINNGNRTFTEGQIIEPGRTEPTLDVALADINKDGILDLYVANDGGQNNVHQGNGDGTFQPAASNAGTPSNNSTTVELADFNGDGFLDAVLANNNGLEEHYYPGNGTVVFDLPNAVDPGTANAGEDILIFDFDRNGTLDIYTPHNGNDVFYRGNGDGTFQAGVPLDVSNAGYGGAAGDFNGDGILDVVIALDDNSPFRIGLGDGSGGFTYSDGPVAGISQHDIVAGDFNRDGRLDVFAVGTGANPEMVFLGNGNGTFQSPIIADSSITQDCREAAVGFLDMDNHLDVAVSCEGGVPDLIYFGNGDGTFQTPVLSSFGENSAGLAIGDLNGW